MAEHAEIERIAREVVNANTAPDAVVSVSSSPSIGWDGDDILRIKVELKDEATLFLRGKAPSAILLQLSDRLVEAGEERFPIVSYATADELAADGDPKSAASS